MTPEIHILNGSALRDHSLDGVVRTVEAIFALPVVLERWQANLEPAFDASRKQTNSTVLLKQILKGSNGIPDRRIAIVDVDLFIPVLTFVFGEAQLRGSAAIVSTHRLANQFYGMARDDALMVQRLEKETVHELGHTFGLYHCRHFECVMRSSTYVEEIDMKRITPCPACNAAISASAAGIKAAHPQKL